MMKRRLVVLTLCVAGGEANGGTGGSTSVTDSLNGMIQGGDPKNGVYVTGKGVLVRAMLDGLENGNNQGLPTTLWSNDIYAVSQMYPDRVDLFGWDNIYDFSTVGFVVGSAMPNLFFDFDSIQTQTWGWGVFYAHDSNCMDLRCRWLESDQIYDCPGGYIPWGGQWISDATKVGAGGYPVGNPYANKNWGGGTGCHVDMTKHVIDQLNQKDASGQNLVEDKDCQCNYHFNGDWSQWVTLFAQNDDWSHFDLHADQGICWVNNPRDMINMQNALFWSYVKGLWKQTPGPFSGTKPRDYMGWNEIPVDKDAIMNPTNWDTFVIKLPANLCGNGGGDDTLSCLGALANYRLSKHIYAYKDAGYLLSGIEHVHSRPGSYSVVAREWQDGSGNWQRWFFCQNWWELVVELTWIPQSTSNPTGVCYITFH